MPLIANPLQALAQIWVEKCRKAREHKKRFQDSADESMLYFYGPPSSQMMRITRQGYESGMVIKANELEFKNPNVIMSLNKAAELVQLFGPALYAQNPNRKVNPRQYPLLPINMLGDPNDPSVQQQYGVFAKQVQQGRSVDAARAMLMECYLNGTVKELNLYDHTRMVVDEALLKGRGVWWVEFFQPPGSTRQMAGSFYDSVDNLYLDPDAEKLDACKWAARLCIKPTWEVEDEYQLPRDSLKGKGQVESFNAQMRNNAIDPEADYRRRAGETNDLIAYWKIYSKMGLGARLKDAGPEWAQYLDRYGQNCFLVVADGVPFPLNLPPDRVTAGNDAEVQQRIQWPVPFWVNGGWPFEALDFHPIPRQIWPMSHLKPAMGELKFLNWCFSHMASKIRVTCRDMLVIPKEMDESIARDILHGPDLTVLKPSADDMRLMDVVKFISAPQFNGDLWKMIEAVSDLFDKRTGLTQLVYGQTGVQIRSAAEADFKSGQLNVRPADMRAKVEQAMAGLAVKEALAARTFLKGADVAPVIGPMNAPYWDLLIGQADFAELVYQQEFTVEAGSTVKPDKAHDQTQANTMMQTLFQPLFQFGTTTGQVGPVNALLAMYGKAFDVDVGKLLIPAPPPPPPPMPGPPPGPPPGGSPHPVSPAPTPGGPR